MLQRLSRSEDGSALTEFAVIVPLFILLILWSTLIADVGLLRIKVQEVARYGLWEMTVQKSTGAVERDVRNIYSGKSIATGASSFLVQNVRVEMVEVEDRLPSPIDFDAKGLNGFASADGAARSRVRLVAPLNASYLAVIRGLAPGGDGNVLARGDISMVAETPVMLVDTFKAWPGKYALREHLNDMDLYRTYPSGGSDSPPEREVAERLSHFLYAGMPSGLSSGANLLKNELRIPDPISFDPWAKEGPVSMFAGAVYSEPWSPGYMKPLQRAGRTTLSGPGLITLGGTDRFRFTSPGVAVNTSYWNDSPAPLGAGGVTATGYEEGGYRVEDNPYRKAYKCRGPYFLGSFHPVRDNARWGGGSVKSVPAWASGAYVGCP